MRLLSVSVALLFLFSCMHEEVNITNGDNQRPCQSLAQISDWKTIDFKSHLTIQVPHGYFGGISGIEGPVFTCLSPDTTTLLQYAFCGALYCEEYGSALNNIDQDTFTVTNSVFSGAFLDQRMDICIDQFLVGIYYYNLNKSRVGCLFWLKDGAFRQSLFTFYPTTRQPEIEQILLSIKEK